MNRFHGKIGYAKEVETSPGVWEETITEREYFGDIVKNKTSVQQGTTINAGISMSNSVSIVGDPYAYDNIFAMRYVTYLGKKWNVTTFEVMRPRIIINMGGLYNG